MTDNSKPEWLEHLSVLRLEPGDVVVLRTQQHLAPDHLRHVVKLLEKALPGHVCLVLTDGMEMGVVRAEGTA